MPTIDEITAMVEQAGGDPQKLSEAVKQALSELGGAQKALHETNKEAADRRKKLEALEAAENERKQAAMTETQKLAEQAKALEERATKAEQERDAAATRANETLLKTAVMLAAGNFNDPKDAWTFIDKAKIKLTEAGEVEGVEKAIEELAKQKPYLLKSGQTQPPQQRPNGTPPPKQTAGGGNKKPESIPVVRVSY
jgi:chromosome segregation ATPase